MKPSITVYLLEDVDDASLYVINNYDENVALSDNIITYYKEFDEKIPVNLNFFLSNYQEEFFGKFKTKGYALCNIVKLRIDLNGETVEKYFAVTFGFGHFLLNKDLINKDFGLRIVLNLCDDESFRKIKKRSVVKKSKITDEQMPVKSHLEEFDLNVQTEILDGITVNLKNEYFEGNVIGKDSLTANVEYRLDNIDEYLEYLYESYLLEDYLKKFPYFGKIKYINNKSLKEELDNILQKKFMTGNIDDIILAIPELIEWDQIDHIKYPYSNKGSLNFHDDIEIEEFINTTDKEKYSRLFLSTFHLFVHNVDIAKNISFYKCILAELEFDNRSYCLVEGKYYEIDKDFKSDVEEFYNNNIKLTTNLSMEESNSIEKEYNENMEKHDGFILLDRKIIHEGIEMEFCDLIYENKFIHVKKYMGSSVMSHLFNQGLNSANMLKRDSKFLAEANKKIQAACDNKKIDSLEYTISTGFNPSDYEIVYAIIHKNQHLSKPQVSFFTKLSLREATYNLTTLGYKTSIIGIKNIRKEK